MADLAALKLRAREAGIFTDFDGCLAPIVRDPSDAAPLPGVSKVLSALANRFRLVAVVSGRAARDLAWRLRAPGVVLVGLHGMEEIVDGEVRVAPEAGAARARVEAAHAALEIALRGVRGAVLEHKGLALAVHFRRAENAAESEALSVPIVERVAREAQLEVVPGRRILEVRPRSGGDKGDAVRALIDRHGLKAALVAGDDVGDLPAFDAVAGLDLSVRVAVASEESPRELSERADVVVSSQTEFLTLLKRLGG